MESDPRFPPSLCCSAPTISASWSKSVRGGVKDSNQHRLSLVWRATNSESIASGSYSWSLLPHLTSNTSQSLGIVNLSNGNETSRILNGGFSCWLSTVNHFKKSNWQRFYITTLLKLNCKRSDVSTYLFKHLLLLKQLCPGHTSNSQGLCSLSPGSSLWSNKHLNKPSYLPRQQYAHQALFWTFEKLTYKLAGR